MEEKDLWLKKVKEKLEDYSEPIPASGWEQLEKELSASVSKLPGGKSSTHKRTVLYRRWTAVAAAAAVLVAVSAISIYFLQTPEADTVRQISAVYVPDEQPVQQTPHLAGEPEMPLETPRPSNRMKLAKAENIVITSYPEKVVDNKEENRGESVIKEVPVQKTEPVVEKKTERGGNQVAGRQSSGEGRVKVSIPAGRQKGGKWSMGVMVGNLGSTNSDGGEGVYANPEGGYKQYMAFNPFPSSNINTLKAVSSNQYGTVDMASFANSISVGKIVIDSKHKQPISFGLSVRKELAKNFSIESGVIYTLLSSEIMMSNNRIWEDQKLHYIGIPVRAGWNFYQRDGFTLYASAGGTVEKCVYGRLGDNTQTVDKLQFSVGGAVGAQLNLTKRLGLYAEPGVVHYFDDGSSVETIRKEKSFNFNLQAGFRLTY